jgi:hypothetical protein
LHGHKGVRGVTRCRIHVHDLRQTKRRK